MTANNDDAKHKLDLAMDSLKRFDHYIATTNFKVGLLASFLAAGLALAFAPLSATPAPAWSCTALVQLLVVGAAVASAGFLLQAVFPRLPSGATRSRFFFDDVRKWSGKASGYSAEFKSSSVEELLDDVLEQNYWVAGVAAHKFAAIQKATRLVQFAFLPALLIALVLRVVGGA